MDIIAAEMNTNIETTKESFKEIAITIETLMKDFNLFKASTREIGAETKEVEKAVNEFASVLEQTTATFQKQSNKNTKLFK